MARSQRIDITLRKQDKHFTLVVENEPVAVVLNRQGAVTLEHLLRGCIKYSSRKLFRQALQAALQAKDAPEETTPADKPPKAAPAKSGGTKPKAKAKPSDHAASKPSAPPGSTVGGSTSQA